MDRWELSKLQKENKQLEQKFVSINSQLKELEKKVYKISDFSKKLQLITNFSPDQVAKPLAFGKVHSRSNIIALSSSAVSSRNINSLSNKVEMASFKQDTSFSNNEELEVRIEKLEGKSELVKQDVWTLYTDLLERQEILNNTPSILPTKGWVSSEFGYRNETIYADHDPYFHRGLDIASAEG